MKRLFAMLAAVWLTSCGEELSLEQQIIGVIGEMEASAENAERGAFMDRVAESFSGQQGTMTRREFQRFMFWQMNQYRRMHAQLFPITVRREGVNTAGASFNVLVTGGQGLLPESGQLFEVTTRWVQQDGDWLLLKADWTPAITH